MQFGFLLWFALKCNLLKKIEAPHMDGDLYGEEDSIRRKMGITSAVHLQCRQFCASLPCLFVLVP